MPKLFFPNDNLPVVTPTLIRWYKGNNNLNDSSGNGKNLTGTGTYDYEDAKNGIGSSISVGSAGCKFNCSNSSITNQKSYSFAGWFYKVKVYEEDKFSAFFYDDRKGPFTYGIRVSVGDTSWFVSLGGSSETRYTNTHSLGDMLDEWVHVCITFNYSGKEAKFYANGVYVNKDNKSTALWYAGQKDAYYFGTYNSACYSFRACDLRIYYGVLTDDEVFRIYKYLG